MPAVSRRVAVLVTLASVSTPLVFATPSQSCLNDRDTDTLAEENRALPGMVEVITGRFERNPPLYYRMRIARIDKELARNPDNPASYDDIAVAYDRLGESAKALEWMAKKREFLPPLPEGMAPLGWGGAWYRYYANTGTFRVHRWLRDGADRNRIGEVKLARAEIAKAIAIKPDAHFGRETYQLQVMDWIIAGGWQRQYDGEKEQVSLAAFIEPKPGQPLEKGLAGLIVLGNAWESTDVFSALGYSLKRNHNLALLAHLRVAELEQIGRKPLIQIDSGLAEQGIRRTEYRLAGAKRVEAKYPELRAEAEAWQTVRTEFMMARLSAGRHPDTDPAFWSGYRPKPAPSLSTGAFAEWKDKTFTMTNIFLAVFYGVVGIPTFVATRALVRWCRGRV